MGMVRLKICRKDKVKNKEIFLSLPFYNFQELTVVNYFRNCMCVSLYSIIWISHNLTDLPLIAV